MRTGLQRLLVLTLLWLTSTSAATAGEREKRYELFAQFGGSFFTDKKSGPVLMPVLDTQTGNIVLRGVQLTSAPGKGGRVLAGFRYYLTSQDAFEASYSYSPNYLRESQRVLLDGRFQTLPGPFSARNHVHQVAFNYVRYLGKGRWRPFASGGLGFAHFTAGFPFFTASLRSTKFAANFGGGIDVELNPRSAIRFEFRDYLVGQPMILDVSPRGVAHQYGPSLGLALKF